MQGLSSKAANGIENRRKFNDGTELESKEFSDGSGLEFYATDFRSYDPQIGRFWQVDPIAEQTPQFSPFVYANNNPILLNDPYGLTADSTITPVPPPPSNMPGKSLDEIVVVGKSTKPKHSGSNYKWYQFFNDHNPGGDFLYEVNKWNPIANVANAIWTYSTGHDSYGIKQSNTQATIQLATAFPIFKLGKVVNVLGSTGRVVAKNLSEQIAMQEIMSNPNSGKILRDALMNDQRWHHSDGWVKMSNRTAHGVEIHYVANWKNGVIQAVDDFKFVDKK